MGLRVVSIEDELATFADENPQIDNVCADATRDPRCDDGESAALVTNIGWALAGTFALGAVIAYFAEAPDERTVEADVGVAPGGASASLRIRF